jgi:hypothetical protein
VSDAPNPPMNMNSAGALSINELLAAYIDTNAEAIVDEWLAAVRADSAIPTASHTAAELKNHFPALFGNLVETLRSCDPGKTAMQENARMHGSTRWREGFSPREMLREIKHLRSVMVYHLRVFEDLHSHFGGAGRIFVCAAVHGFLDDLAIDAIDAYLELEQE